MSTPPNLHFASLPIEIHFHILEYCSEHLDAVGQIDRKRHAIVASFLHGIIVSFHEKGTYIDYARVNYERVYEEQLEKNGPHSIQALVARVLNHKQESQLLGDEAENKFTMIYGSPVRLSFPYSEKMNEWLEQRSLEDFCKLIENSYIQDVWTTHPLPQSSNRGALTD